MTRRLPRELFIYWHIEPSRLEDALVAVLDAQAMLRAAWPGLTTQVYERCDPATQATVMETYAAPGGIDALGQARIDAALHAALASLPAGARHVEAFVQR